jgi:hypothetical protein
LKFFFYKISISDFVTMSTLASIFPPEGGKLLSTLPITSEPKKTQTQIAKEERAKKAAFKAKLQEKQEILKSKEAEELALAVARDAEEATKKKEIATLIKHAAQKHAEAEAEKHRLQKELDAKEKIAKEKRANRRVNTLCSSGGWEGCTCTWCRITPSAGQRLAIAIDGEARQSYLGNAKSLEQLQAAYRRGGAGAVKKIMR